jgi:hypothetical protein
MVSLRQTNFEQLLENDFKVIGFPEYSRQIEQVKPGDIFVLHIGSGKSLIPEIVEATSEYF